MVALRVHDRPAGRRAAAQSSSPGTNPSGDRGGRAPRSSRCACVARAASPTRVARTTRRARCARASTPPAMCASARASDGLAGRCCDRPCWWRATRSQPRFRRRSAIGRRPASSPGLSVGLQDALSAGAVARAGTQRHQPPDGDLGHAHRHVRGDRGLAGGTRAALATATRRARQRRAMQRCSSAASRHWRMVRSPAGRCRRSARSS